MKIGIMTFHASNNCGSMLQAFALQKVLTEIGYESEIIDYSNIRQRHMYAFLKVPLNYHDFLHDISTIMLYPIFRRHYQDYIDFKQRFLKLSNKNMKLYSELKTIGNEYDIFISGSDQVWNTMCPDADDAYYLNFTCKRKIGYAPSFGNTNINSQADNPDRYKEYLKKFDYISIREKNGSKWIKELTGIECPVLLDPTLLLSKQDYSKVCNFKRIIQEKYIFYYAFSYSDEVNVYVKNISDRLKLPVYIIDARGWLKRAWKYKIKLYKSSGPITFMNLLFNAELVLTTSFHGTAFSVIGKKNFWFIDSKMRDRDDDRALTLLLSLNLSDRMALGTDILNRNILENIDYDKVYKCLSECQTESINWLYNAITCSEVKQ